MLEQAPDVRKSAISSGVKLRIYRVIQEFMRGVKLALPLMVA